MGGLIPRKWKKMANIGQLSALHPEILVQAYPL